MSVTTIEPLLLQHLSELYPGQALTGTALGSVYHEACTICREDIPGNFIHLDGEDPLTAVMLIWVVRQYSRQLRLVFIPEKLLSRSEIQAEIRHAGSCVQLVDRLLSREDHACNWLGMVALLNMGATGNPRSLAEITALLGNQLVSQACIVVRTQPSDEWQHYLMQSGGTISGTFVNELLMLRWQRRYPVSQVLPAALVAEFAQDDPVHAGVTTLMSANERFQLYYVVRMLLPRLSRPLRFIEIGSFAGGTFYEISMALKREGISYQGISVEPANVMDFKGVLSRFQDNVVHLEMFSYEAKPILDQAFAAGAKAEFLLIDGDHRHASVCRDIQDYYPLVAPGGIIMFHDYLPPCDGQNHAFVVNRKGGEEPGVGEACRELLECRYGLQPLDLPLLYPTDPSQTLASQAIIPGVYSTIRAYRKPAVRQE